MDLRRSREHCFEEGWWQRQLKQDFLLPEQVYAEMEGSGSAAA